MIAVASPPVTRRDQGAMRRTHPRSEWIQKHSAARRASNRPSAVGRDLPSGGPVATQNSV